MMKYINGKIFFNDQIIKKDFAIVDNKITFRDLDEIESTYDLNNLLVIPGLVDLHIHARNPGFSYKDKLTNVNKSLLAGGFTHAIAQSNIEPLPISVESLKSAQELLSKTLQSNVIQAGRITYKNKAITNKAYLEKVKFITDDGMPVINKKQMKKALKLAKKYDIQMILHEQDMNIKGHLYHCSLAREANILSFDAKYESNCVFRDVALNKKIHAKIHLQHISTLESLMLYDKAKKSLMPITAELTPHHLLLNNEMIKNSGEFAVNPPLPIPKDQRALLEAFKSPDINIIATDHAPHSEKEKAGGFSKAVNGIIGLESAFALINTLIRKEEMDFSFLINAMSINPGKLIGVNNAIEEGNLANLTIVDPNEKWTFTHNDIKSKASNTPFLGYQLVGKVKNIIINGELINK